MPYVCASVHLPVGVPWVRIADKATDFERSRLSFADGGRRVRVHRDGFDTVFAVRSADRGFATALLHESVTQFLLAHDDLCPVLSL